MVVIIIVPIPFQFKVIGGERLKFNINVPKEVAEFITKRVWDGNVAERYTMQKILDCEFFFSLFFHINLLA
jgi:hypothetical protein